MFPEANGARGVAAARPVGTWPGYRRVVGSSPAQTTLRSVDGELERCQLPSPGCAAVLMSKVPNRYLLRRVAAQHICPQLHIYEFSKETFIWHFADVD